MFVATAGIWLPPSYSAVLVDLDATSLPEGALPTWTNTGTEPGDFVAPENGVPSVSTVQSVKGVTFDGTSHYYTGPAAPWQVTGGGARTVEAWILNPQAADEETIFSWGRRGGPDGSNASFNHGVHGTWGAVGHWGAPDIGWNGQVVQDRWTYVVYTYDGATIRVYSDGVEANSEDAGLDTWAFDDTAEGLPLPFRVAAQNEANGTPTGALRGSMTIAKIRVHDEALDASTIQANFNEEAGDFGLGDQDNDGLPSYYENLYTFLNPSDASDASKDEDSDGLTNLQEFEAGTMPDQADSDGDGINDSSELNRMVNGSAAPTDPLKADTDGDGLSDALETGTGTFVSATDTGTDPLRVDSDDDGFSDSQETALGSDPNSASSVPAEDRAPVVSLDSEALAEGPLAAWPNEGSIDGTFVAPENGQPVVQDVQGVKAVSFNGTSQYLTGPAAPTYLTGNSSRTVEAWILNPEAADEETIFSWGRRGGPDGSNTSFNHGVNGTWGAVGHWGGADIGWNGVENVKQGIWTYVVYSYNSETQTTTVYVDGVEVNSEVLVDPLNTHAVDTAGNPLPFRVASQNEANGTSTGTLRGSMNIAEIHVYDRVLDASVISANFTEGQDKFGLVDYDDDGLPTWYERQYNFDENNAADAGQDTDNDGLTNLEEFFAGTHPRNADTDGDGLNDGAEANHPSGPTNPFLADTDQDGLEDGVETGTGTYVSANNTGTDPHNVDSDFDGFADGQEVFHGSNPSSFDSQPTFDPNNPLVDLDAAALATGELNVWPNLGAMGGEFTAEGSAAGVVDTRHGTKGVSLDGIDDQYVGPVAPVFLTGDAVRSVDAWIYNPEVNTEESVVAWGRREGPDGSNASYTHGTHPEWGAMGQWGAPDVGWGSATLAPGTWTHLAYVYDGAEARVYENGILANTDPMSDLVIHAVDNLGRPLPFRVGAQNMANGTPGGQFGSLTIGRVRVYDQVLTGEQILAKYNAERSIYVDAPTGIEIESAVFNDATRQLVLSWNAAGGTSVDVEATQDFETWETVATDITDGQYTETVPTSGYRFYRLRVD